MKKVLFIGINGLVGKRFNALFGKSYQVFGLDKDNIGSLQEIVERNKPFGSVVFAAQSPDYKSPTFTADLFDVNVRLLFNVLSAISGATGKFVYFSSGSVYAPSTGVLTEESKLNIASGNPYIASKLIGEEVAASFKGTFEQLSILRPFFIYGPGQAKSMLVETMRSRIENGDTITLASGRGLDFNPVFGDDVARLLQTLIDSNGSPGMQMINVFGNQQTSLKDVVKVLETRLGKNAIVQDTQGEPGNWRADTITQYRLGNTTINEGLASY